jgi:hypothetical protein
MNVKPAIALLLTLVFQLVQVLPAAAAARESCRIAEDACECCPVPASCHCADDGQSGPEPQPAPILPGDSLKVPPVKITETRLSVEIVRGPPAPPPVAAAPLAGMPSGYQGTRLSVAFCSFVI